MAYALSVRGQVKKSSYLAVSMDTIHARWVRNHPNDMPLSVLLASNPDYKICLLYTSDAADE